MAFALPPGHGWFAGLFVWVPLAIVAARGHWARTAAIGWVQGILAQAVALGALPGAVERGAGAHALGAFGGAFLLIAFEAGRFSLIGALAARAVHRGWTLVLAFPLALAAGEAIYPLFFPWTTALFVQSAPVFLQGAELGGPVAITLLVGVVDAALALAWQQRAAHGRVFWRALAGAAACVGVASGGGAWRMHAIDEAMAKAPVARIGVVQGDLATRRGETRSSIDVYREVTLRLLRDGGVDLLVWPETAIGAPTPIEDLPQVLALVRNGHSEAKLEIRNAGAKTTSVNPSRIEVPMLLGAVVDRDLTESAAHIHEVEADGTWKPRALTHFNSAVLVGARGQVLGVYDKRDLVAFGERIPGEALFPWLRSVFPNAGRFAAGTSSAPLTFGERRIATFICFEDILPARVFAGFVGAAPDLIVDVSSDAWFGHSRVPFLHVALARLRAVEHRRYLVQATNSGVSAVVDANGRIQNQLESNQLAAMVAPIRWLRSDTPYETLGDVFAWIAAAGSAGLCLMRRRWAQGWGGRCRSPPRRRYSPWLDLARRPGTRPTGYWSGRRRRGARQ